MRIDRYASAPTQMAPTHAIATMSSTRSLPESVTPSSAEAPVACSLTTLVANSICSSPCARIPKSEGWLRTSANTIAATAVAKTASMRNAAESDSPCMTDKATGGSSMPATPLPTAAMPTAVPRCVLYQRPVRSVAPTMPPSP